MISQQLLGSLYFLCTHLLIRVRDTGVSMSDWKEELYKLPLLLENYLWPRHRSSFFFLWKRRYTSRFSSSLLLIGLWLNKPLTSEPSWATMCSPHIRIKYNPENGSTLPEGLFSTTLTCFTTTNHCFSFYLSLLLSQALYKHTAMTSLWTHPESYKTNATQISSTKTSWSDNFLCNFDTSYNSSCNFL